MGAPAIGRYEDRNYVGLCHLDVVELDDVDTVPREMRGNVADDVELVEDASWSRIWLEDEGGLFEEQWVMKDGDMYAVSVIRGVVARDRLALMPNLWEMKGRRYLVVFTTKNGDQLLMGRKETPATVTVTERRAGDGARMESDRNQYEIVFTLARRLPVPFYQGEVPDPPPSGGTGGTVNIRNAADDTTLATVTAPDSYPIPSIRVPYVDSDGATAYFVVYVDGIDTGELTVTEPGGGAPPVPRFRVFATDGTTPVTYGAVNAPDVSLPQSQIKYKNASNVSSLIAASDTEFASGTLRPATEIPRRAIRNTNNDGFGFVTAADLVNDTVMQFPVTVITKPDGTTTNHFSGNPYDVRTLKSGIAYQFGLIDWSGQTTVYRTGGEASLYSAGWFANTRPPYPYIAELASGSWDTLTSNNIFGNTMRFTNESGAAAAGSGNRYVLDHYKGLMHYIPSTLPSGTWNDAIDANVASTQGGYTDWRLIPINPLMGLCRYESGVKLNYSPFNITATIFSGTTNPDNTAQARCYGGSTGNTEVNSLKTNTANYFYTRRFF